MWLARARRSLVLACTVMVAVHAIPTSAAAQTCVAGTRNSCLSVFYTAVRPTPVASDYDAGVAVIGTFEVRVLKCGRPPCTILMAAANQPSGGLRVRAGGTEPTSLSQCPIDLTGVTSVQSSQARTIAIVNATATFNVWLCRPLSWNPAVTPVGSASPEVRFRIRQN